jgi:uncharacterized membrane protein YesL
LIAALLLGLFSVIFSSVPYYWDQRSPFGIFSLLTLGVGTFLFFLAFPFYFPVRRHEGLGLFASVVRSFRIMIHHRGSVLLGGVLGLIALAATVATLGLFPGLGGLEALHQGIYDYILEKEKKEDS